MKNIFRKYIGRISATDRIEFLVFLFLILMGLIIGASIALTAQNWEWLLKIVTPLVVTLGVLVALDNLLTSEQARREDKKSEESRFRYDLNVKHLQEIRNLIDNYYNTRPSILGSQAKSPYFFFCRLSTIIQNYEELQASIIAPHSKALKIEESSIRDQIDTLMKGLSDLDLYSLSRHTAELYHPNGSSELRQKNRISAIKESHLSETMTPSVVALPSMTSIIQFLSTQNPCLPCNSDVDALQLLIERGEECRSWGWTAVANFVEAYAQAINPKFEAAKQEHKLPKH